MLVGRNRMLVERIRMLVQAECQLLKYVSRNRWSDGGFQIRFYTHWFGKHFLKQNTFALVIPTRISGMLVRGRGSDNLEVAAAHAFPHQVPLRHLTAEGGDEFWKKTIKILDFLNLENGRTRQSHHSVRPIFRPFAFRIIVVVEFLLQASSEWG